MKLSVVPGYFYVVRKSVSDAGIRQKHLETTKNVLQNRVFRILRLEFGVGYLSYRVKFTRLKYLDVE